MSSWLATLIIERIKKSSKSEKLSSDLELFLYVLFPIYLLKFPFSTNDFRKFYLLDKRKISRLEFLLISLFHSFGLCSQNFASFTTTSCQYATTVFSLTYGYGIRVCAHDEVYLVIVRFTMNTSS